MILQALRNLHADIGHFRRDSQLHTPRALLLNLLLALPGAIVLAGIGSILQASNQGHTLEIGEAFWGYGEGLVGVLLCLSNFGA